MEITKEFIKSELFKKIPELNKYRTIRIEIENKEVMFHIESYCKTFTTEVDFDNKNIERLLDELTKKIKELIKKVDENMKLGK